MCVVRSLLRTTHHHIFFYLHMSYGVEFEHYYFEKVKRTQLWAVVRLYSSICVGALRKLTGNIRIGSRYLIK
jgi:hypothetical protein